MNKDSAEKHRGEQMPSHAKKEIFDVSKQIWEQKYRYRGSRKGMPEDRTVEDSLARVARAAAAPEKNKSEWTGKFLDILHDFRFLPGGRIISNAGTERQTVTMFNCYVMNTIEDSIEGIFDTVKEAALTQKQGGGVGFDFSTLRPAGSHIKGCEASSSGPISFMQVLDSTCRTIMSAGQRRGAQMGVMRCDHPDIMDFIAAKRKNASLQMFNLSVAVTDKFMRALKKNEPWELVFNGEVKRTVHAVELWEHIMRSTYDFAEPGVVFIDHINQMNNLRYCEEIRATNPCVTADTWVHGPEGPGRVSNLVGRTIRCRVDGKDFPSKTGFFKSGRKQILKLVSKEGCSIRLTCEHPLRKVLRISRNSVVSEWAEAGSLRKGDKIMLNNHRGNTEWKGGGSWDEGYLMGLLIGDGTVKADKTVLSVWPKIPRNDGIMEQAMKSARKFGCRRDFKGWLKVAGRSEFRLSCAGLANLAKRLGMRQGRKAITDEMEKSSSDFCRGLLRGLFDSDGSVQGNQRKGVSIRLSQSDLGVLQAVQRILLRLGIVTTIYRNRRSAGKSLLPDGKGSKKLYPTKAQHELVVSGDNIVEFARRIAFSDRGKGDKLRAKIAEYRRSLNRENFVVEISEISKDGIEDVYDVEVPGANSFDANGFLAHNCGEQPLPPYGACLLGSVNLTRFVKAPFSKNASVDYSGVERTARTAVRLLDNVIEISRFPLEAQKAEARRKRRMGIGITGLADAFCMLGMRYGDKASLETAGDIMRAITFSAYEESCALAREKGTFELFSPDKYLRSEFLKVLPAGLRNDIRRSGMRNSHLTSIAPTGTISLLAGNISSGIEPIFALKYKRKIRTGARDENMTVDVYDHAYMKYTESRGGDKLPDFFVTSDDIPPEDHIGMQAALQKYVDSSISKTINVPADFPYEKFKEIYRKAYDMGLKGCTTFRPSEHITGVLIKDDNKTVQKPVNGVALASQVHLPRPTELEGTTYKIKTPLSSEAIYLTINDIVEENCRRRPYELFINTKNLQHFSWIVAMTRLISAVFRREPDPSFLVDELKSIYDPNGGYFSEGKYVPSLAADIGFVIEKHLIKLGMMQAKAPAKAATKEDKATKKDGDGGGRKLAFCPQCNQPSLYSEENCLKCLSCGYSKCS